jgi:hypothetical protein
MMHICKVTLILVCWACLLPTAKSDNQEDSSVRLKFETLGLCDTKIVEICGQKPLTLGGKSKGHQQCVLAAVENLDTECRILLEREIALDSRKNRIKATLPKADK